MLIETQLMDYNKGAPLANEIINHLSLLGFVIFDIYELHYTDDGRLNEIDIMFCRPDNHLLSHSHTHAPNKRSMWLKYDICLNRESPRKIISQIIKRASRKKYKD